MPLDTKLVISEMLFIANLLASSEPHFPTCAHLNYSDSHAALVLVEPRIMAHWKSQKRIFIKDYSVSFAIIDSTYQ